MALPFLVQLLIALLTVDIPTSVYDQMPHVLAEIIAFLGHYIKYRGSHLYEVLVGCNSSVGVATGYLLDSPGSNLGEARPSTRVQIGSGAHPVSCKMCTGSHSRELSGRSLVLTTQPHLEPKLKKE